MLLIWLFSCFVRFSGVEGYQSRFTSIPSKPTFTHSGNNLTLIWRYHLSHADKPHFRWLVFGLWTNGDISTPLMSVSKNGKLVSYSDRIAWLGNKTTAAFRLHGVTIQDGGVYGCKLDFGAHVVRDSVRLAIIVSPRIEKNKIAEVKALEGEYVVIPCHVTGHPRRWIAWSRDGQILQNSTKESALKIPAARANMTGLYTCVAGNEAGIDKYNVLLLVTSCKHQSSETQEESDEHRSHDLGHFHVRATFTPTLVVAFILFVIFGAYFFFRYAGARSNKFRTYNKMSQDEQARSLMGEWSSFADSGEKI
ncbi:hypothetical protein OS493_001530 [Desmophyllum pertusum]|uniref:Ig-like domain-containing protein n=1 Tax=Desmophyllum pertusum TaxID=174260 RepID=A0A9W9ZH14_9CNID|nr:hypothetical protein OS493_001530 [Desmophyllum pertusum]